MPRYKTHITAGAISGLIVLLILGKIHNITISPLLSMIAILFSVMGSTLPDKIEPAKNSKHRKFFHSKVILFTTSYLLYEIFNTGNVAYFNENILTLYTGFILAGYLSHLILDATTPSGLPLF
ncbi:metal-dependent hydrolase [Methanohalobium sp.]|uniref:metal-dependent hydrolase n=1 Tax=Methanohalobium sp. TaxID=2837493 RepID=UPI0025D3D805|nr:metal-dependent hydrolase [Methanohalobium sp.]